MKNNRKDLSYAKKKLQEHWGFSAFRSGQAEAIDAVLNGRQTLVLFPTGGGKSLCYQVPATVLDGLTLVISPLVALMQDQVEQLHRIGVRATYINSTISGFEVEQRLINARNHMYKLLYLAPERLATPLWQHMAQELEISLVAVDEAHCISQWGHDFRPSYRMIRQQMDRVQSDARWIALTATATPEVRDDIITNLNFTEPVVVASGFRRPNLRWWVNRTVQKRKLLFRAAVKGVKQGSGIVYAGTRAECEKIANLLSRRRIPAKPYHAGLDAGERYGVQQGWVEGIFPVVVATNAFGMGIDKSDCRFVIHYDMPYTVEAYYQEAGRAGRDGGPAYPLLLYKETDYHTAKSRLMRSYPGLDTLEKLYDVVCDELGLAVGSEQEQPDPVALHALVKRSSLSSGTIRSGLKVLERLEILELVSRSQPQLGIQFTAGKEIVRELVNSARPPKAALLDVLFRQYSPASFEKIHYLEFPYILEKLNVDRNTLMKAVRVLAEQDHILNYHVLEDEPLVRLTAARMSRLPAGKKEVEGYRDILLRKLEQMKGYAETENCRESFLRIYFGESGVQPCGNCDRCMVPENRGDAPRESDISVVRQALTEPSALPELARKTGWNREKLKKVIRFLIVENRIKKSEQEPDKFIWNAG